MQKDVKKYRNKMIIRVFKDKETIANDWIYSSGIMCKDIHFVFDIVLSKVVYFSIKDRVKMSEK